MVRCKPVGFVFTRCLEFYVQQEICEYRTATLRSFALQEELDSAGQLVLDLLVQCGCPWEGCSIG